MANKKITARAKCASFDIEMSATIVNKGGLVKEEMTRVEKKLKQKLAEAVASLPFSHVYPYEVRMR